MTPARQSSSPSPEPEVAARIAAFDALLRSAVDLRRHVEAVARHVDLSAPQARLLVTLGEPLRMQQAAEATACEPSHLTALADQLQEAGVITRRTDPHDGRARQLALTAKGRRIRERLVPAMLDGAPVVGALDQQGCDALTDLLTGALQRSSSALA